MSKSRMEELMWWYLLDPRNSETVKAALLELYFQQTQDEQSSLHTNYNNKSGFSRAHAKMGSILVKILLSGKDLDKEQLAQARKLVMYYHKQVAHLIPMDLKKTTNVAMHVN